MQMGVSARVVSGLLAALGGMPACAATQQLADLSLEQLRDVLVMTVSRVDERLDRAAASAYVISAEAIRRSGAATVPEALRLAPKLIVARADANQYAISARGFNNVLANKLLVLIDGRTVYSPLFSGVFWEAQDVMLEDVERIEVISGAGRRAVGRQCRQRRHQRHHAPRGGDAGRARLGWRAATGSAARRCAAAATLGDDGHYRVYAQGATTTTARVARRQPGRTTLAAGQAGFRADWSTAPRAASRCRATRTAPAPSSPGRRAASIPARTCWRAGERSFGEGADASVQAYVERTEPRASGCLRGDAGHAGDVVAAQYGWLPAPGHRVLRGRRRTRLRATTSSTSPPSRSCRRSAG